MPRLGVAIDLTALVFSSLAVHDVLAKRFAFGVPEVFALAAAFAASRSRLLRCARDTRCLVSFQSIDVASMNAMASDIVLWT